MTDYVSEYGDGTYTDYDQIGAAHVVDYETSIALNRWQREGRWGEAQVIGWATTFWVKDDYYIA